MSYKDRVHFEGTGRQVPHTISTVTFLANFMHTAFPRIPLTRGSSHVENLINVFVERFLHRTCIVRGVNLACQAGTKNMQLSTNVVTPACIKLIWNTSLRTAARMRARKLLKGTNK